MKPPPIFFPGELEENPVVAQIAIYGGVTWDGLIPSRWDSLLSESQSLGESRLTILLCVSACPVEFPVCLEHSTGARHTRFSRFPLFQYQ